MATAKKAAKKAAPVKSGTEGLKSAKKSVVPGKKAPTATASSKRTAAKST